MYLEDLAAAAKQMRETRLMSRLIKLPIRRPAVADQHAVEVGAEHRRGLRKPAALLNPVEDHRRGREGPQPLQVACNLPAGFIGADDWTRANRLAQDVVRWGGLAGRPMQRMRHPTWPKR
jgi:hypothetical protein